MDWDERFKRSDFEKGLRGTICPSSRNFEAACAALHIYLGVDFTKAAGGIGKIATPEHAQALSVIGTELFEDFKMAEPIQWALADPVQRLALSAGFPQIVEERILAALIKSGVSLDASSFIKLENPKPCSGLAKNGILSGMAPAI